MSSTLLDAVQPASRLDYITDHAQRCLDLMAALLRQHTPRTAEPDDYLAKQQQDAAALVEASARASDAVGIRLPDVRLAFRRRLQQPELRALWLAVAPYLDERFRDLIARVNDNVRRDFVDASVCQRLLCDTARDRMLLRASLQPGGSLHSADVLTPIMRDGNPNPLYHELVPHADVVSYLSGFRALHPVSAAHAELVVPRLSLDDVSVSNSTREVLFPLLKNYFERPLPMSDSGGLSHARGLGLILSGPHGSGRRTALKAMAGSMGRNVIMVDRLRPRSMRPVELANLIEHLCREADLYNEILVFCEAESLLEAETLSAQQLAHELSRREISVVFCVAEEQPIDPQLDLYVSLRHGFTLPKSADHTVELWQRNATPDSVLPQKSASFEGFVGRFSLSPAQVRKACQLARLMSPVEDDRVETTGPRYQVTEPLMEFAASHQNSSEMGGYAVLMEPNVTFADLVLEDETHRKIQLIIEAVRNRYKVLRTWKIGYRIRRGIGICCLFDGEPGTGKTLSAEVIASELGMKLMRVNIPSIVDKYIGETEKNLARVFERARPDSCILLFDEADSLFSKRTEVKSSNDRYANMDINVLLQLIEAYEGVTLLTTNLKQSIDNAFERRITFKVSFALPEEEERIRLWQHMLPDFIPTAEEIDYELLAEVELSGGSIKNAILRAAYDAAQAGSLLKTDHLIDAAYQEAATAGKLIRQRGDEESEMRRRYF